MTKKLFPPLKEIVDPNNPPEGVKYLIMTEDLLNYPGRFKYFFIQESHLSIVSYRVVKRSCEPDFISTWQFDAPLSILPWFVNKFEFFTKMPHEGGLPHGKISTDDLVEGEDIGLTRLMGRLNARGDQGYSLYNYSRKDFDGSGYQSLIISDSYLFQGGFFETWKELANKYENGTL